ncbi:hypothetical protein CTDIVETGP_1434 [Clostridium tyrobutyricum DIVETGP]|uniref:Uncharacterized protein n=1 Tax=Clostridium tyrobutyricum DIVETGP TaxID=1408889 RepID=W6N7M6_CLOTY|nr:hypothetical protein CTK_C02800 [Clostridium tyrobutyricum]CDL91364.1 hypothetical protein CTDIVETGP_1434 [Clostridium tyrobutyricum DIVETGP]
MLSKKESSFSAAFKLKYKVRGIYCFGEIWFLHQIIIVID